MLKDYRQLLTIVEYFPPLPSATTSTCQTLDCALQSVQLYCGYCGARVASCFGTAAWQPSAVK